MKLYNFEYEGIQQLGVLAKDGETLIPFSAIDPGIENKCMTCFIEKATDGMMGMLKAAAENAEAGIPLADVKILAPIEHPRHDIIGLGFNYFDHMKEAQTGMPDLDTTEESGYFLKRANKILGPGEAFETCDYFDPTMDHEAELAVIIGKAGKNVKEEDAEDIIFGYSVFNDVTGRQTVMRFQQWFKGKSFDNTAALVAGNVGEWTLVLAHSEVRVDEIDADRFGLDE